MNKVGAGLVEREWRNYIRNSNFSMPIIKWEPFSEFDKYFDDRFFPSVSLPSVASRMGWDLAVDLFQEKGNVIAKMTLPGIDPEKLEIEVNENMLRIGGSREEEKETKDKDYYSKEIRRGSFSRTVSLPAPVDQSKVSADYKDGILQVTMPAVKSTKKDIVKVKVAKK